MLSVVGKHGVVALRNRAPISRVLALLARVIPTGAGTRHQTIRPQSDGCTIPSRSGIGPAAQGVSADGIGTFGQTKKVEGLQRIGRYVAKRIDAA